MTILPQLEHDLFQAANECLPAAYSPDGTRRRRNKPRATDRWSRSRRRLSASATAVPLLLGIAIAVIIAAFALTLAHRGSPSAPVTPASSVQVTRQQLIQLLGVLRRPQTKADLDPELVPGPFGIAGRFARRHMRPPADLERWMARLGYPKLDQALVRVVHIPAWDAKVGIETATWRPSPTSPQRSEGVVLVLWIGSKLTIPPSSEMGTGPRPTSISAIRAHGLALADNVRGTDRLDGVLLVPDGVARITLGPMRITQSPVNVDRSRFGTATATVHNNIATFQLAIPTVRRRNTFSGLFGTSALAETTWFDSTGKVIKRTTTDLPVFIKVVGGKRSPFAHPRAIFRRRRRRFCRQNPHAC